jgi:tripartite-type tricarboxylate transporter receptor subunit TctC
MIERMQRSRRRFLQLAAGAAALPAMTRFAWGQSYPTRPVRIVAGTSAGGGIEFAARLIAQALSERLGEQFYVENRVGGGTNMAAEMVVRASPDGYTLYLISAANAINATLYEKLNFNFIRDIAPIASIARVPQVMVVHPSVPARTVSEFIAYAKANPGKLNMASAGIGSVQQVGGELFKMMSGVDMLHVPFKGAGPALVALLGGQVQVMFDTMPGSIQQIRAGTVRALAVTTASRLKALPELPTVADSLPGYEAGQWYGLGAPRTTPAEIVDKLNKEVNGALSDSNFMMRLSETGGTPLGGAPADFSKFIVEETDKWAKVVNFSGAKVQ